MIKIGELLSKLWSLKSCFNILPPGALTPQGIEGAMRRDVGKHWCTLQWCASRGWFITHENWTSWMTPWVIRGIIWWRYLSNLTSLQGRCLHLILYKLSSSFPWWRHQMETFSALLTFSALPTTGEFPSQRPVMRSFDAFFDLRLGKWLCKQSRRRWFETASRSLWRYSL